MFYLFLVVGAFLIGGGGLVCKEVWNAPLGEETENGFELTWANDRPDAKDVSCIWSVFDERSGKTIAMA